MKAQIQEGANAVVVFEIVLDNWNNQPMERIEYMTGRNEPYSKEDIQKLQDIMASADSVGLGANILKGIANVLGSPSTEKALDDLLFFNREVIQGVLDLKLDRGYYKTCLIDTPSWFPNGQVNRFGVWIGHRKGKVALHNNLKKKHLYFIFSACYPSSMWGDLSDFLDNSMDSQEHHVDCRFGAVLTSESLGDSMVEFYGNKDIIGNILGVKINFELKI